MSGIRVVDEPMEEQVKLEKLPRPCSELNCRQARTYLVKLLRSANGGQNPHYGNPDMKPPFWPDYYWPWSRLTDVHTKPRGMREPLQYSEMMKLAISRGYQYFGYDPNTFVDRSLDTKPSDNASSFRPTIESVVSLPANNDNHVGGGEPPRLFRPLSKMNCVHARTILAKLLRYQQQGNNPVYGNPDTRPPWWPDHCIRWIDMVDLRGKPPYLPDNKSYTDVLKIAIESAYKHYGCDPETYLEVMEPEAVDPIAVSPPKIIISDRPIITLPQVPLFDGMEKAVAAINTSPPNIKEPPSSHNSASKHVQIMGPPPKIPIPVNKLNCGGARTALSKLLRYQSGNQPPNYGNPSFMPAWWPNEIIDWSQIKNLSHRYEGYLGNSYSNCLRIALIRGYAYYGLDANEYIEDINGGVTVAMPTVEENIVVEPTIYSDTSPAATPPPNGVKSVPKLNPVVTRKPMPRLVPIEEIPGYEVENLFPNYPDYPPELLDNPEWYPPKLRYEKAIAAPEDLKVLKKCKVRLNRRTVPYSAKINGLQVIYPERPQLMDIMNEDLENLKYTDIKLLSSDLKTFPVHRCILAAHSSIFKELLREDDDSEMIIFPEIKSEILKLLIESLYRGKIELKSTEIKSDYLRGLSVFQSFGLLIDLKPSMPFEFIKKQQQQKADLVKIDDSNKDEDKIKDVNDPPEVNEGQQKAAEEDKDEPLKEKENEKFVEAEEEDEETAVESMDEILKEITDVTETETEKDKETEETNEKREANKEEKVKDKVENLVMESNEKSEKQEEEEKVQETEVAIKPEVDEETPRRTSRRKKESGSPMRPLSSNSTESPSVKKKETPNRSSSRKRKESVDSIQSNTTESDSITDNVETTLRKSSRRSAKSAKVAEVETGNGRKRKSVSSSSGSGSGPTPATSVKKSKSGKTLANHPNVDGVTDQILGEKAHAGPVALVEYLIESGFLVGEVFCSACNSAGELKISKDSFDGCAWFCTISEKSGHMKNYSIRKHSIFEGSSESLSWIMKIILCWSDNTSLNQCQQNSGADVEKIFHWYDKCRDFFGTLESK